MLNLVGWHNRPCIEGKQHFFKPSYFTSTLKHLIFFKSRCKQGVNLHVLNLKKSSVYDSLLQQWLRNSRFHIHNDQCFLYFKLQHHRLCNICIEYSWWRHCDITGKQGPAVKTRGPHLGYQHLGVCKLDAMSEGRIWLRNKKHTLLYRPFSL